MSNDTLHPPEPFCHFCHDGERAPQPSGHLLAGVEGLRNQVATLTEERDRIARVLAVECGDASQAPNGWYRWYDNWRKDLAGSTDIVGLVGAVRLGGEYHWNAGRPGRLNRQGTARSFLEAMEAVDEVLAANPNQAAPPHHA